jgi:hypothetical protein
LRAVQEFVPVLLEETRESENEQVALDRGVAEVEGVVVGVNACHFRTGIGKGAEVGVVEIESDLGDAAGWLGRATAAEGSAHAIDGRGDRDDRRWWRIVAGHGEGGRKRVIAVSIQAVFQTA